MRKTPFINGEYYHIFNRGVDKREIFSDREDLFRFFQSMDEFNAINPIGSIYANSFVKKDKLRRPTSKCDKLVNFVAFCLNPNHYHFILEQLVDGGISEFMKRLGGGYTKRFNDKHKRSGSLFQGRFKSVHINTNEYLLHVSAYVNLNNIIHRISVSKSSFVLSSWDEYINVNHNKKTFCEKGIILEQFSGIAKYKEFAENSLISIREIKDMKNFLLD